MLNHLNRRHPTICVNIQGACSSSDASPQPTTSQERSSQKKVSSFFVQQRSCPPDRAELISNLVCEMIAKDLLPASFVDGINGFQKLMAFIEPQYSVPSRQTIMRRAKRMYDEEKNRLQQELSKVLSVAVTTDAWTSLATDSYMTLTCHWIEENWKLRSTVLETVRVEGRHTAENLAFHMNFMKEEWGLSGKIVACVRDNASNFAAAGAFYIHIHRPIGY